MADGCQLGSNFYATLWQNHWIKQASSQQSAFSGQLGRLIADG
jgi:hypothetical protein